MPIGVLLSYNPQPETTGYITVAYSYCTCTPEHDLFFKCNVSFIESSMQKFNIYLTSLT